MKPTNEDIARVLERIADLLEAQDDNPFRIRSYRDGAASVRAAEQPVAELVRAGNLAALKNLPNIGQGLAAVIAEYVETGQSDLLQQLESEVDPASQFAKVPGIGPELAQRIVDKLHIKTLAELEQAAHAGRLDEVEGFGPKRVRAVEVALAGLLSGAAQRRERRAGRAKKDETEPDRPDVATLLAVDVEYRRKAKAGELKKIAPRRFNPDNEAWLPILHTEQAGWDFTVLYSNTAQAHELGTTHDWVVIYYQRPGREEDQATVVTETGGRLKGKRVVRGREAETGRYYEKMEAV